LALRRVWVAPIIIAGLVIVFGVLRVHHGRPADVIDSLLIGSSSMLALLGGWTGIRMVMVHKVREVGS
jgi:hypothetical protein